MKVLKDARLTVCCGQHYCDICLTQWLQKQRTCPHCRKNNFQSVLNLEKIREINEFRIRCINHWKGCEWIGELGALKEHVNVEHPKRCSFLEVKCTNYGYKREGIGHMIGHGAIGFGAINYGVTGRHVITCEVKLTRQTCGEAMLISLLVDHKQNECKYRQFKCTYCGCVDTYDAIAGTGCIRNQNSVIVSPFGNHYTECGYYPIQCPNKCGKKDIKRKVVTNHQEICPLKLLYCHLCSQEVLRKNMEHHLRTACDFRNCTCMYCGIVGTRAFITGKTLFSQYSSPYHYDECAHYPMGCPNKCGSGIIIRKDMKAHRQTCPLERLNCPFRTVGCTDMI